MKKIGILTILAIGLLSFNSCSTTRKQTNTEKNEVSSVTGEIIAIQNGKDGYTATIKDFDGKEYYATISIVNLQKSGGDYKAYKVGDKITVSGSSWKDTEGKMHITVHQLKEVL